MSEQTTRRQFLQRACAGAALVSIGLPRLAMAAGLTLDEIKRAGALRIGCEATYPPLTYRDSSGTMIGYDVDLANAFCRNLGVKAQFIDTVWSGVIPSLYTKKFDLVMSSLSYTAEREKRVDFSVPYVEASQALLIRAADQKSVTGITGMNGKVLGLKLGSPGQTLEPKLDAQLKAAGGAGFKEVKTFDDHPAAYIALAEGKVDGVLNTLPTLSLVLKNAPGKYAIVKGIGADNWAGIAARTDDTALIGFIDQQLRKFKTDGTLHSLQQKWFGFDMNLPDAIPVLS
ncbi:polar amino acid transport system substrate-binding protein [Paraburkholderia sp. GAS448]|uniref:transporter substrate-binding domain-containing protein n=1 Tax=Paraburkholderia sp. GAS448 TaxID=3035136 RepID=UPI003D245EC3